MGDGSGDSDNLDVLIRRGYEAEIPRVLVDYLQKEVRKWDLCQFNTMLADSPAANGLLQHLKRVGWARVVYHQPWSVLYLPDSWESYLKQVSRNERYKIRYYERRLKRRFQVRFYKCTQESELPICLESLFQLHEKRWELRGERGIFASAARRRFYSEMSRLFLARQWLEFWLLELNARPAAAQFSFRYRDTVYALQQGFDPEYASVCVQDVLRAYVLRQVIAEGVRRYDFLAGRSRRKERWGTKAESYINLEFAQPFSRGSLYLRIAHTALTGKEWLRARLASPAWAALHWLNVRPRGLQGRAPEVPPD